MAINSDVVLETMILVLITPWSWEKSLVIFPDFSKVFFLNNVVDFYNKWKT